MNKTTGKHNNYWIKDNPKVFFYPQDWKKIMDIAKPGQKESLTILINTGARHNEARHIKVEDVDFERNNIILKVTKVRAAKGETRSKHRHIPISSQFAKFLKRMVRTHKLKPDDYFPMLKPQGLNGAIKRLSKKVGRQEWRDFSPHNVRKTFECWLVALDVPLIKIVKHLGHTMNVASNDYISSDIFTYDDKKMIRDIIGDLYSYQERGF